MEIAPSWFMTTKKSEQQPPTDASVHPEAQKSVKDRVPGDESSKAPRGGTDARTGHDRDGNVQQKATVPAKPAR
ncbi:MAG TPA: hypothetical protein VK524_16045 [Polyangiaceae bacterium]|nr:hypothetical protein [Polyangiaceae bacterium]